VGDNGRKSHVKRLVSRGEPVLQVTRTCFTTSEGAIAIGLRVSVKLSALLAVMSWGTVFAVGWLHVVRPELPGFAKWFMLGSFVVALFASAALGRR